MRTLPSHVCISRRGRRAWGRSHHRAADVDSADMSEYKISGAFIPGTPGYFGAADRWGTARARRNDYPACLTRALALHTNVARALTTCCHTLCLCCVAPNAFASSACAALGTSLCSTRSLPPRLVLRPRPALRSTAPGLPGLRPRSYSDRRFAAPKCLVSCTAAAWWLSAWFMMCTATKAFTLTLQHVHYIRSCRCKRLTTCTLHTRSRRRGALAMENERISLPPAVQSSLA